MCSVYIEPLLQRERQEIYAMLSIFSFQEETNLVTSDADKAEVRLTEVKKIMDQLTVAVASVFDKIKCDPSALKEMLGRDDSVTEDNIMQYLGAVEQKTNELLKVQLSLQVKVSEDRIFSSRRRNRRFMSMIFLYISKSAFFQPP